MLSPKHYAACSGLSIHAYYNSYHILDIPCELCQNDYVNKSRLNTYTSRDEYGTNFWYHCNQCGFSGTSLDYLSHLSGQPLTAIPRMYSEHTAGTNIPNLQVVSSYAKYVRSIQGLLQRFQDDIPQWSRMYSGPLLHIDNLDHYDMSRRYRYGSRSTLEGLFHGKVKKYNGSGSRVFRGRNWSKITAIPLYDQPYRVSGFLFINGDADPRFDWTIRRIGPQHKERYSFETGYLCPCEIIDTDNPPPAVVCSKDWMKVLQYQADINYQEQSLAPIVGWFPFDPSMERLGQYRWDFFRDSGINRIFWCPQEDSTSLREACISQAHVSHLWYGSGVLDTPEGLPPGAVLRSVIKSAIPWERALAWYLDCDMPTAINRLHDLNLPRELLSDVFVMSQHAISVKDAVKSYFTTSGAATSIQSPVVQQIDSMTVASRPDGWFQLSGGKETLLSSARCFIDRTISFNGKEPLYQGRILIKDDCVPFVVESQEIEKNISQFIQQTCLDHKASYLPVILASKDKMLRIVRHFANLEITYIPEGYGWDQEKSVLTTPNATISDGAYVSPTMNMSVGPFSSIKKEHFEDFNEKDRNVLLAFEQETPYITAMLASMVPPIFSSAYRSETPQTVVVGPCTDLLHQLFRFMSLPYSLTGVTPPITDYAQTHKCPYLVKLACGPSATGKGRSRRQSWVDAVGLYGYGYIASPLPHALSRMSLGHANMLLLPRHRFYRWLQDKLPPVFLKCMAHCLMYFSRYCLKPDITMDDWNSDILAEALRFFHDVLGLPVNKETVFSGYHDTATYFCDYIYLMIHSERIVSQMSGEDIVLDIKDLADCYRDHIGVFDLDRVKGNLNRSMLLKDHDITKNMFLLDGTFFEGSKKRMETVYSSYIRK